VLDGNHIASTERRLEVLRDGCGSMATNEFGVMSSRCVS